MRTQNVMKMSKSKKGIFYKISAFALCIITIIFGFYYYLGIGFGKAVVKSVIGVEKAKKEWKSKNLNLIDSVKTKLIETIDSINNVK